MFNSASRNAAVLLGAAVVTASAVLPAAAAGHAPAHRAPHSPVVVGAVQYDSPGRDNRTNKSLNGEWVTISNTGRTSVNLKNWTLAKDSRHVYRFKNLRLAGKSSVRVHTGVGRDTTRDVYQDSRHYVWDNKDTATLRDSHKRVIDVKRWSGRRES
ncbi:lamin tail domain-containing protein [Streptomyces sp. NBC_01497]|uniref:lamin tail domain-containing protein n=1 Tax=Streptomyces sp. NBC_01497 TaxID=2903885 RepID=UPI002E329564|nr:lamin tail domain-containing protein [Streptomyces sp. NBC_01497]